MHGSRFYILGGPMNWLNGKDTVIGKVIIYITHAK